MAGNPFKIQEGTIRDRGLSDFNAHRSEGDNMLFMPDFSGWLGKSLKGKNILLFYVCLVGIFGILLARVTYLQIIKGEAYYARAENNRLKVVSLKAPRGIIYDRYGRPLVHNVPRFNLALDPQIIRDDKQAQDLASYLSGKFPEKAEEIRSYIKDYRKNYDIRVLVEDVSYDTAMELVVASSSYAAIQLQHVPRRQYLENPSFAHIIGYTGKITEKELEQRSEYDLNDVLGKDNVERQYEELLRGVDGSVTTEVDALGREKGEVAKTEPKRGSDLILTLDLDMQKKLYEILERLDQQHGKQGSAAVVMDPRNGDVLALVSYPSFDTNLFTLTVKQDDYTNLVQDPRKPLFARAIAGSYPAGSVFKLSMAAAALEEKVVNDTFTVQSVGGIRLGGRLFPDWRAGGHGATNIYKAISDSVNTFFYTIGGGYGSVAGLGVDLISKYADMFGFGKLTNIDLPGETAGFLPTRAWKEKSGEKWYQGDTYNLSIGQGDLLVTPLQVANYTSFFANGGTFVQPHVLKSYKQGEKEIATQAQIRKPYIISATNLDIVRKGMRRTVTDGTAKSMQSVKVPVAGKTGTAQFNSNKQPHSWFTGFAPYDNPELVISVIVEEGGDVGYAVTAARQFLEWYYNERS